VPALPSCLIEPIWEQFAVLLPERCDQHPLGCHRPRIADRVVFEMLINVLVFGSGYRRHGDRRCSPPRCDDAAMSGSPPGSWAGWKPPRVRGTTASSAWSCQHLLEAGFTDVNVRLVPDPARLERGEQLEAFIATVMLGTQLRDMSNQDRRPFVHEVAQSLPEPVIDYVRLQICAIRA
jgi:hypothetical protein